MRFALLGSTGSIGTQTLEICRRQQENLFPVILSANGNWKLLAKQINEFEPEFAVLADESHRVDFISAVTSKKTNLLFGNESLNTVITETSIDLLLNALVGFAGFLPTYTALSNDIDVALANKESLVVGGELLNEIKTEARLIPVDSEHSAIYQCLLGEEETGIEKLILTASGGPFRTWSIEDMSNITVEDALNHPNWSMGSKITIDSATMMNKGLEVIEAKWLFDIPLEKIETVIHPQSIIHSMVQFIDGSTKAQLGVPDMMVPIQFALSDPNRWESDFERMDWTKAQSLTFEPVDEEKFPCLTLARKSAQEGGIAPAVLNAANEVAVERFLNEEVSYISIANIVEECLQSIESESTLDLESLLEADKKARTLAGNI
jgi:1-deoxy-D-xylulose-5-phosphate reductoisomerase